MKYDRYYRIPGITNENRILLETYLTEDEKVYLVENSISVNSIIKYLSYPHFHLENYEYYNQVTDFSEYDSIDEMLLCVNEFLDYSREQNVSDLDSLFEEMNEDNLFKDFVSYQDVFDFDDLDLYSAVKKCNSTDTEDENGESKTTEVQDYIVQLDDIKAKMESCGYSKEETKEILLNLFPGYTLENVTELVNYRMLHPNFEFVENVDSLDTVVGENDYLGDYSPQNLEVISAPRLLYFSYLRKDANNAYNEMLEAFNESSTGNELLVVSGYKSQENLDEEGIDVDEAQLGLTLHLKAYGFKDEEFSDTEAKVWLDQNAYLFGFILRYPEDTTEHKAESYTYRYVGKELAKELHDSGLTLDEYKQQEQKETDGLS